jgi:hypothetical protein
LKDKSPLVYSLVRNLKCLNPIKLVGFNCSAQFNVIFHHLVDAERLNVRECDDILSQFSQVNNDHTCLNVFKEFSKTNDRVDSLV